MIKTKTILKLTINPFQPEVPLLNLTNDTPAIGTQTFPTTGKTRYIDELFLQLFTQGRRAKAYVPPPLSHDTRVPDKLQKYTPGPIALH